MSIEENKAIVRRYLEEIINRGHFEIAEDIFAVDYVNHTAAGGIGSGRDGFINGVKALRTAYPDWTVSINAMIAERDLVCDHVSHRTGDPGPPTPTRGPPAGRAATASAQSGRPTHLGAALTSLEPLAGCRADRATRHRRSSASSSVRVALALEYHAAPARSSSDRRRRPRADPKGAPPDQPFIVRPIDGTERFPIGPGKSVRASFNVYNFLNDVSILTINSNYGSQWRLPSGPMLTVPFRSAGRWLCDVSVSGVAFLGAAFHSLH
jgi:predicted SnoaL-like aldol condensation-catalyzing enzyme